MCTVFLMIFPAEALRFLEPVFFLDCYFSNSIFHCSLIWPEARIGEGESLFEGWSKVVQLQCKVREVIHMFAAFRFCSAMPHLLFKIVSIL